MICDARTCIGCQYLQEQDEQNASLMVFLANCQHAKCKVVRLVRQQISKLQNMQYERYLATDRMRDEAREETHNEIPINMSEISYNNVREFYDETHEPYNDDIYEMEGKIQQPHDEEYDEVYEAHETVTNVRRTETINVVETASLHHAASPGRTVVNRKWMLRILDRFRHRAYLILLAAAVGMIVWSALVYGVFLGATACGSGRTCFASTLRYKHAKRSLF
ncbi:uncharacterized protein LOC126848273 [Cataglyphis hispanica]|uniref:uncharacterized protein LOC126848273 n=1 Tax=Cataglyphis hispanica TaxID=1086592 RepID=UPI00217FE47A|nr:uncharacterized protein LOC126848273 [Cataglyphis hispanica]